LISSWIFRAGFLSEDPQKTGSLMGHLKLKLGWPVEPTQTHTHTQRWSSVFSDRGLRRLKLDLMDTRSHWSFNSYSDFNHVLTKRKSRAHTLLWQKPWPKISPSRELRMLAPQRTVCRALVAPITLNKTTFHWTTDLGSRQTPDHKVQLYRYPKCLRIEKWHKKIKNVSLHVRSIRYHYLKCFLFDHFCDFILTTTNTAQGQNLEIHPKYRECSYVL